MKDGDIRIIVENPQYFQSFGNELIRIIEASYGSFQTIKDGYKYVAGNKWLEDNTVPVENLTELEKLIWGING